MSYNKEEISKRFQKGRYLLDHAYYNEAIEIFTELIKETDSLKDSNSDAKLTWDVSLNNRGVAKCKSGYSSGNKALYEEGLEDYRTTVNYEMDLEQRKTLTAQANLTYGEKEIKDFDTRRGVNFKFEEL